MLRTTRSRLSLLLVSFFSLSACGGGGGGGADVVTPPPPVVNPPPQPGGANVSIGTSSVPVVIIGSGAFEDVSVSGDTAQIWDVTEEAVITALDSGDNIIFLGLAGPDDTALELNGTSTVEVLLKLIPTLALHTLENPGFYDAELANLGAVVSLATYIDDNADWALGGMVYSDLLSTAISDALSAYQSATAASSSKPSSRSSQVQQKLFIDLGLLQGVDPTYSHTMSGATVTIQGGEGEMINIGIENDYRRWVVAFLAKNPESLSGDLSIDSTESIQLLEGDNDAVVLLAGRGKSLTIAVPPISLPASTSGYGIHMYGPALGDFGNRPLTGQASAAYWLATAYTTMFEVSLPTFGKVSGSKSCLAEIFDPEGRGKDIAKSIAASTNVRSYIEQDKLSNAGVEVMIILSDATVGAGISCLTSAAQKQLTRLIPIFGQLKLAFDLISTAYDVTTIALELVQSKSQLFWNLSNTHEQDFYMIGEDYILAPTYGSPHYTSAQDLAALGGDWSTIYSGTCDRTDPKLTCEAYSYAGTGPYIVEFRIRCKDPVDGAQIACKTASILDQADGSLVDAYQAAEGSSEILFERSYDAIGEYKREVQVLDVDGGTSEHYFNLQIKQAQPQVVLRKNGTPLPGTVQNGVLVTDPSYKMFCCEEGETETTETFELFNLGYAGATINTCCEVIGDTSFSARSVGVSTLARNESTTFEVTYTPTQGQPDESATVKIAGTLGGAQASREFPFKDYSEIQLVVEPGVDAEYSLLILEYTNNYVDPRIVAEYGPGDDLTVFDRTRYHVGLKRDGEIVQVSSFGNMARFYFPSAASPDVDETFYYEFTMQDLTNGVTATVPLNLTVSTEGYRKLAGSTLTMNDAGGGYFANGSTVRFDPWAAGATSGGVVFTAPDGTETPSTWQRTEISSAHTVVTCADFTLPLENTGGFKMQLYLGGQSFFTVMKDHVYVQNTYHFCPENAARRIIIDDH